MIRLKKVKGELAEVLANALGQCRNNEDEWEGYFTIEPSSKRKDYPYNKYEALAETRRDEQGKRQQRYWFIKGGDIYEAVDRKKGINYSEWH